MLISRIIGSYQSIDDFVSRIGDQIPIRFRVEVVDRPSSKRRFHVLRQTFLRHKPSIEISTLIGSGGFADVFRAKSEYDGVTDFAIKILKPEFLDVRKGPSFDPEQEEMRVKDMKKRFSNEGFVQWDLSKSLSEKVANSVVRVFDHGEFDGRHGFRFILMEQMASTLRDFIVDKNNMAEDRGLLVYKVCVMMRVAEIIESIHSQGIFHRDIKPENVLFSERPPVSQDGEMRAYPLQVRVKLGDFGTVRWMKSYTDKYDAVIIGSQCYMSPEQIYTPENLDARTDIYSFGVVCYELLHGAHPKNVDSGTANLLEKLAKEEPTPRTPPKGFEGLSDIIFRCMNDKYKRYQSMAQVVKELREFAAKLGLSGDVLARIEHPVAAR